jgi:hypothetical protein
VHEPHRCRVPRRGEGVARTAGSLVEYADGDRASVFAVMLGGLIEANVLARPEKRRDFEVLEAAVGIQVEDIGEAVTLRFRRGRLVVANGLRSPRHLTIRTDAATVMELSNLNIGALGLPVYVDATGRSVVGKLLRRRLKIDGLVRHITTLNRVTRLFSVR